MKYRYKNINNYNIYMNYCGSPIYNSDSRFLETFDTVNSKPIEVGRVEKDYKYNSENDVDVSLGIRENIVDKQSNQSFVKYYWQKIWS
jgi:hypothetical protein